MRGADHGRAGRARELGEECAERQRVRPVEAGGRLVGDDHARADGDGASEAARARWPARGRSPAARHAPRGRARRAPPRPPFSSPRSSSAARRSRARRGTGEAERLPDEREPCAAKLGATRSVEPAERDPSTSTSPSSGSSSPARRCSSVVFPEPDGPVTTESDPARTPRRGPRSRSPPRSASSPRPRRRPSRDFVLFQHYLPRRLPPRPGEGIVLVQHELPPRARPRPTSRGARLARGGRSRPSAAVLGERRSQPPRPTTIAPSPEALVERSALTRPSRTWTTRSARSAETGRG